MRLFRVHEQLTRNRVHWHVHKSSLPEEAFSSVRTAHEKSCSLACAQVFLAGREQVDSDCCTENMSMYCIIFNSALLKRNTLWTLNKKLRILCCENLQFDDQNYVFAFKLWYENLKCSGKLLLYTYIFLVSMLKAGSRIQRTCGHNCTFELLATLKDDSKYSSSFLRLWKMTVNTEPAWKPRGKFSNHHNARLNSFM